MWRVIGGALAVGLLGWVAVSRAGEVRAARESMAQAITASEELNGQLHDLAAARGQKERLAAALADGRAGLRQVADAYLVLDRQTAIGPNLLDADAGPRWVAARSALTRVRSLTRACPADERATLRTRLLGEFAAEFPDRPLAEW